MNCEHEICPITEISLIPLSQGKVAIIDRGNFDRLNQWQWYAMKSRQTFYAVRNYGYLEAGRQRQGKILMHRNIMGTPKGLKTDHANHDGLYNRKYNLRVCTAGENQFNKLPNKNCKSQYKGVYHTGYKWAARIRHDSKAIWLGSHTSEIDAAKAYDQAAMAHYGEFAYLNFPSVSQGERICQTQ